MTALPAFASLLVAAAQLSPQMDSAHAQAAADARWHGSGTSWQPASAPHGGLRTTIGAWALMVHAQVSLNGTREATPRGADETFATNMGMARVAGPVGPGRLEARIMLSAEPTMGSKGYPLLLQTGESADGVTPLFDRQHPHDVVMEAAALYRVRLEPHTEAFAYVAPVGEPAIGPSAFMHRGSAGDNPLAPISHHFLDGTHISYGVVTVGVVSNDRLKIEASAFNGREPDQDHWTPDHLGLDSWAVRVGLAPGSDWVVQASMAKQTSPERVHPGIDYVKATASATWNHAFTGGNLQVTAALGRNKRQRTLIPVPVARRTFSPAVLQHYLGRADTTGLPLDSLILYFPGRIQHASLLEAALTVGGHQVFGRMERAQKDELFLPSDPRHSNVFGVGRLAAGYAHDLRVGAMRVGVGAMGSVAFIPTELVAEYGRRPTSGLVFGRIELG